MSAEAEVRDLEERVKKLEGRLEALIHYMGVDFANADYRVVELKRWPKE